MPGQWQNSACGFRWYYCPQIYNRFWPASAAFLPGNKLSPEGTDDTFYRNPEFPAESEYTHWYRQVPASPAHRRTQPSVPPQSWAAVSQDSAEAPVYSSFRREDYTSASVSHFLPDRFCKEFFSCQ